MRWLQRLFRKTTVERQLDSELRFHIEQSVADLVAAGTPPPEALRQALIEFGGVERFKEECREARWVHHLDVLSRDLRFAYRGLVKDRRFALIAIFALGLGIGASTSIFSVVYNGLIAPLPYKDASRTVTFRIRDLDFGNSGRRGYFSFAEFQDFVRQNHVFDAVVGNAEADVIYTARNSTTRFGGNYVTPGTCEFFGLPPFLGRALESADYQSGAPPVFLLRYATWVSQFNADPSIIGKTFILNGTPRTLVGIAAPRFAWGGVDLWMPRDPDSPDVMLAGNFPRYWGFVAHLKAGLSVGEAQSDLTVVANSLSSVYPKDYPKHFSVEVDTFTHAVVSTQFRRTVYLFFIAVGLLLLIGCGNVANLLLVRATTRSKEFAVRIALGASRWRLIRHLLAESFLLAVAAAILGIFLAWAGVKTLAAFMPQFTIPSESVIEMNVWVLAFAVTVGVGTVFLFGLAPALQASRCDLSDSLRDSGKGLGGSDSRSRVRSLVIVAEVALSLTLLFAAGLFIRSFVALQSVPLGLQSDHVFVARIPLPPERYKDSAQINSFFRPLIGRLKSIPGALYASAISSMPPYGGITSEVQISGKSHSDTWKTLIQLCSEDYFSVLRIPLLAGRSFSQAEVADARKIAVVNSTFKRRYFGDENPIGYRIHLKTLKDFPDPVPEPWFEIIGVAADVQNQGFEGPVEPEIWAPFTVTGSAMRGIIVRTAVDPVSIVKAINKEVWATDPSVALAQPQSLDYFLDLFTFSQPRFGLFIVSTFAVIGLILVTLGVYSVIAYSTSRRTHEIGIRMALGAAGHDVLKMVIRNGLVLLAIGILLGAAVSLTLSRLIVRQLWGVSAFDPLTLTSVASLVLLVGLLACAIPARRATRINPVTALRHE